jgi:hypothetical protein
LNARNTKNSLIRKFCSAKSHKAIQTSNAPSTARRFEIRNMQATKFKPNHFQKK